MTPCWVTVKDTPGNTTVFLDLQGVYDTPPGKLTRNPKMRFGRWCSFSMRWFSGSMCIFRGVCDVWIYNYYSPIWFVYVYVQKSTMSTTLWTTLCSIFLVTNSSHNIGIHDVKSNTKTSRQNWNPVPTVLLLVGYAATLQERPQKEIHLPTINFQGAKILVPWYIVHLKQHRNRKKKSAKVLKEYATLTPPKFNSSPLKNDGTGRRSFPIGFR